MDLGKVNKENIHLNVSFNGRKDDINPPVQNAQDEAKRIDNKPPSEPSYWQNLTGVSKSKDDAIKALIDKAIEEMKSSACFIGDGIDFDEQKKKLEALSKNGSGVVLAYKEMFKDSCSIWREPERKNFLSLADSLLETCPEVSVDDAKYFSLIFSRLSSLDEHFEVAKSVVNDVLAAEGTPKDKTNWLATRFTSRLYCIEDWGEFQKNALEDYQAFTSLVANFEGDIDVPAVCCNDFEFSKEEMKNVSQMMENGSLKPKTLEAMVELEYTYKNKKSVEALRNILAMLLEDEKAGDRNRFEYLDTIYSRICSKRIAPVDIEGLIIENSTFKKNLLKYFKNEQKDFGPEDRAFYDVNTLKRTLKFINRENFKDYKNALSDETKTKRLAQAVFTLTSFTNPKTKLFDKKMYDLSKEFDEKNLQYISQIGVFFPKVNDTIRSAKACVDGETGEINKDAVKFLDKYAFESTDGPFFTRMQNKRYKQHKDIDAFYSNSSFERLIPDLVEFMKDKNGAFNAYNIKCVNKIAEAKISGYVNGIEFFDVLKNEDGVVDKEKFKTMLKLSTILDAKKLYDTMKTMSDFDKETAENIMASFVEMFGSETAAIRNFASCAPYLFTKDGEANENNCDFAMSFLNNSKGVYLPAEIFEVIKNEDNKQLILDLNNKTKLTTDDIKGIVETISKFKDEDGKLPAFVKEKIFEAVEKNAPLQEFGEILSSCIKNEDDIEKDFDKYTFDCVLSLFEKARGLYLELTVDEMIKLAKGGMDLNGMPFKRKVKALDVLRRSGIDMPFVNRAIIEIDNSLSLDNISLEVNKEDKTSFVKSVIGTPVEAGKLTEFEKVLVDSIPFLESLEDGLVMKYSRQDFLSDLSKLCDNEDKIKILSEKTDIIPVLQNGEMTGYNGIITFDKLDVNNQFEKAIYDICHKFMYENEVETGNKKFDDEINKIIKAAPEFINTIGKKQHGTHKFTLDIHQLLVLAYSIQNPDYLKLNKLDRVMLKTASIFHDIAKTEAQVDRGHQYPSSIYARSIIKKFFDNQETRDRVYELIKNHHWLEEYNTSYNKDNMAKEMAYRFRRPNDFEIAKIMAKSDLMAVSEEFYNSHKNALNNFKPIEDNLETFYSTGCALFTDYPCASFSGCETVDVNGKKCKIINLHKASSDDNMKDFGFRYGISKKDLRFLVHMVEARKIKTNLETVKMLTSPVNGGVLSESLITPEYNRTYCNRKYGVILSQINANLININDSNQASGYEKEFKDLMKLVFGYQADTRSKFKDSLLENLNIDKEKVSKKEFAVFFRENIVAKDSLLQYPSYKEYCLGGKTFTGEDLRLALTKCQDEIIDKKEEKHNEIVGYVPKIRALIAKETNVAELPQEFLEFASDNDLPVVLI